jgi:hypothetical protein
MHLLTESAQNNLQIPEAFKGTPFFKKQYVDDKLDLIPTRNKSNKFIQRSQMSFKFKYLWENQLHSIFFRDLVYEPGSQVYSLDIKKRYMVNLMQAFYSYMYSRLGNHYLQLSRPV